MNLPSMTATKLDGGVGLLVGVDVGSGEDAIGKHEVIATIRTTRMAVAMINFLFIGQLRLVNGMGLRHRR